MKMHCPHCGVKGSVDDSYIGRKIRCPKCQKTFHCELDAATLSRIESDPAAFPAMDDKAPSSIDTPEDERALAIDEPEYADSIAPEIVPVAVVSEIQADDEEPGQVELAHENGEDEKEEVEEIEAILAGDKEEKTAEIVEEQAVGDVIQPETPLVEPVPDISPDSFVEEKERENFEAPQLESDPVSIQPDATSTDTTVLMTPAIATPGKFSQGAKPRTDFTLGEALSEAWQYAKESKALVWAATGMMYLIVLIVGLGLAFLQTVVGFDPMSAGGIWVNLGTSVLNSALSTVLTAGLMYVGVRRAAEKNCSWKMVFAGFPMAVQLLIAFILMTLLMISGFVLLILPGIYLWVGYSMTLPLMLDRNLGPWEAMEVSRRAIHKVWWQVFGLYLLMGLIFFVSAIPLGIGLIWTVPMSVMLFGVVYRYLFGVQQKNY